jgi:8-oxo-dGTP pyrophosphatase MutT (NUDIX family)
LRELTEEAAVDVAPEKHLLAIVGELHGRLGAVLLVEAVAQEKPTLATLVKGNEEWTGNQLRWYPVDEMDRLDLSQTLEGVSFAAEERRIYRETRTSVLWP